MEMKKSKTHTRTVGNDDDEQRAVNHKTNGASNRLGELHRTVK